MGHSEDAEEPAAIGIPENYLIWCFMRRFIRLVDANYIAEPAFSFPFTEKLVSFEELMCFLKPHILHVATNLVTHDSYNKSKRNFHPVVDIIIEAYRREKIGSIPNHLNETKIHSQFEQYENEYAIQFQRECNERRRNFAFVFQPQTLHQKIWPLTAYACKKETNWHLKRKLNMVDTVITLPVR